MAEAVAVRAPGRLPRLPSLLLLALIAIASIQSPTDYPGAAVNVAVAAGVLAASASLGWHREVTRPSILVDLAVAVPVAVAVDLLWLWLTKTDQVASYGVGNAVRLLGIDPTYAPSRVFDAFARPIIGQLTGAAWLTLPAWLVARIFGSRSGYPAAFVALAGAAIWSATRQPDVISMIWSAGLVVLAGSLYLWRGIGATIAYSLASAGFMWFMALVIAPLVT